MRHVEVSASGELTDARLRDCVRVTLDRPDLAAAVWARLERHLEAEVLVDGSEGARLRGLPSGDEVLHGTWRPYAVNSSFRVCRYPGDGRGHFGPHQDSAIELSPDDRSLLTVNGYCTSLPSGCGGCTRFLIDELPLYKDARGRFTIEDPGASVRAAVCPREGGAAVFYHGLMHDSEPLLRGAPAKWIWRTEVMFRRVAPASGSAPAALAPEAGLARRMERDAERIERVDAMHSMELYRLASRLRDGRVSADAALERYRALRREHSDSDSEGDGDPDL